MTITSLETANNPTALAAGAAKSSSASKSAAFGFDFADMLSRVRVDSDAKLSILSTERSAQPLAEPEQRRDDAANTSAESDKAQNASDDTSISDEKQAASDNGAGQQQQNAGQQQQGASASPLFAIIAAQQAQNGPVSETTASTTAQTTAAPVIQDAAAKVAQPAQISGNAQATPEAAVQAAAAQTKGKAEPKVAANANTPDTTAKAGQVTQQQAQDIAQRLQPGEKVQVNVRTEGPVEGGMRTPLIADNPADAKLMPTDMRGMAGQVKPDLQPGQNGQAGQNGQNGLGGQNAGQPLPQPAAQATAAQTGRFDTALMNQAARFDAAQPAAASNSTTQTTANPLGKVDGMPAPSGAPTGLHNINQTANTAAAQTANAKRATPQAQQAMQQVTVNVSKALSQGLDRIEMQLKPAHLGRVDVQLEVGHDGRVNATVQVDKPETLELMKQDAKALEQALKDAGLKADGGSLQFSLRGEGGNDGSAGGQKTAGNQSGPAGDGDGIDKNEAGHPEHQDIVSDDQINVVV